MRNRRDVCRDDDRWTVRGGGDGISFCAFCYPCAVCDGVAFFDPWSDGGASSCLSYDGREIINFMVWVKIIKAARSCMHASSINERHILYSKHHTVHIHNQ